MAIIYIILIVIILACIATIVFIFVNKLPDLKLLDTTTLHEERSLVAKKKIVAERLSRKAVEAKKRVGSIAKPTVNRVSDAFKNFHDKILEMNDNYIREKQGEKTNAIKKPTYRELLKKAQESFDYGDFDESENCYIEILSHDRKNVEAYERLSEIYAAKKEYGNAEETLKFIVKVLQERLAKGDSLEYKHKLAVVYEELGTIYRHLEEDKKALENFKMAVETEPRNPKYLDELLEISIIVKDKKLALETLHQLKETDPDNKKISDMSEIIENMK